MPKKIGFGRYEENFPGSDITGEELEFLRAVEQYQKKFRRRYPSWREVLKILLGLGYRKVADPTPLPKPPAD